MNDIVIQDNLTITPIKRRARASFPFPDLEVGQGFTVSPKTGKTVVSRAADVKASLIRQRKTNADLAEREFVVGASADGGLVAVKRTK